MAVELSQTSCKLAFSDGSVRRPRVVAVAAPDGAVFEAEVEQPRHVGANPTLSATNSFIVNNLHTDISIERTHVPSRRGVSVLKSYESQRSQGTGRPCRRLNPLVYPKPVRGLLHGSNS